MSHQPIGIGFHRQCIQRAGESLDLAPCELLRRAQGFVRPLSFRNVHHNAEHPRGLPFACPVIASASGKPMDTAVRPYDSELGTPVEQLLNSPAKTPVDMDAILGMHMLDENCDAPIGLGDGCVVSKALVVTE